MGSALRRRSFRLSILRIRLLLLIVGVLLSTYVLMPLLLWTYNIERASRLISAALIWPSPRTVDSLPVLKDDTRLNEALGYLTTAIHWRPDNERPYRLLGQIYVARGDLTQAANILETARIHRPHGRLLAWDVSLVYDRMWQRSLLSPHAAETKKYARLVPESRMREAWQKANVGWSSFVVLARNAINAKRIEEARLWTTRARLTKPQDDEAWRSFGMLYRQLDDLEEASLTYTEAIRLSPQNRDNWYELGALHLQKREATKALDAYERALDAPGGTLGRSLIYYQIGIIHESYLVPADPTGAWDAYEQALISDDFTMNPIIKVQTYLQRGHLRAAQQLWDDALVEYTNALLIDQENIYAQYSRAFVLWRMGNHAQAREALNRLISLKPDYKESYRLLGTFAQEEDNLNEARRMYQRVLYLDPQDESARMALEALK